jgi:hypothetical protein
MNFKLTLENTCTDYCGNNKFVIENYISESVYQGTLYEYNQIQFVTKSGGVVQWLQDYMQFEQHEATYIAEQLNNWHYFINNLNNKE